MQNTIPATDKGLEELGIEYLKLTIEDRKLSIEEQKLEVMKASAKWTSISTIVPLLAIIATVFYGFWNTREQSNAAFRLEVAKGIIGARDSDQAYYRAQLFPRLFPDQGLTSLSKEAWSNVPGDTADRFTTLVSGRGLNAAQTAELWRILFPTDEWARKPEVIEFFNRVANQVPPNR